MTFYRWYLSANFVFKKRASAQCASAVSPSFCLSEFDHMNLQAYLGLADKTVVPEGNYLVYSLAFPELLVLKDPLKVGGDCSVTALRLYHQTTSSTGGCTPFLEFRTVESGVRICPVFLREELDELREIFFKNVPFLEVIHQMADAYFDEYSEVVTSHVFETLKEPVLKAIGHRLKVLG